MKTDDLKIHYDCISKTVLLQRGRFSHVLRDRFPNKEAAERAAQLYAADHWKIQPDDEAAIH